MEREGGGAVDVPASHGTALGSARGVGGGGSGGFVETSRQEQPGIMASSCMV